MNTRTFAADLPRKEQVLVAATQGSLNSRALSEPVQHVAWHPVPSFAVIAGNDAIINPQQQRDQAKRMHVAMLSYPQQVADLIIKAAK